MERIGFIGLGAMGKPMTRNLMKAGYPANVLTRTRSRVEDLLAEGAVWCNTPKEIAQKSDVVITMLPDTPDVEQVVAGRDGVFDGVRPGMLIIDMSTISPLAVRKLAHEAEAHGCDFLDAPVSGAAYSRILEFHGQRMIERNFKPGFRMRLHRKDLDITMEAGRAYGAALPVTAQVRELMTETLNDGQGDMDNSSFVLLLEKLSNLQGKGSL